MDIGNMLRQLEIRAYGSQCEREGRSEVTHSAAIPLCLSSYQLQRGHLSKRDELGFIAIRSSWPDASSNLRFMKWGM
eukprot:10409873-Karenia_brevis.AAC.1